MSEDFTDFDCNAPKQCPVLDKSDIRCPFSGSPNELIKHISACDFYYYDCDYCHKELRRRDWESHALFHFEREDPAILDGVPPSSQTWLLRPTKCPACDQNFASAPEAGRTTSWRLDDVECATGGQLDRARARLSTVFTDRAELHRHMASCPQWIVSDMARDMDGPVLRSEYEAVLRPMFNEGFPQMQLLQRVHGPQSVELAAARRARVVHYQEGHISPDLLATRLERCGPFQNPVCLYCGHKSRSVSERRAHMATCTRDLVECPVCTDSVLRVVLEEHMAERHFCCDVCQDVIPRSQYLEHKAEMHAVEQGEEAAPAREGGGNLKSGDAVWVCGWTSFDLPKTDIRNIVHPHLTRVAATVTAMSATEVVMNLERGDRCGKCEELGPPAPASLSVQKGGLAVHKPYHIKRTGSGLAGLQGGNVGGLLHELRTLFKQRSSEVGAEEDRDPAATIVYLSDRTIITVPPRVGAPPYTEDGVAPIGDHDEELAERVRKLAENGKSSTVSFLGRSGSGKSASMRHVLHQLLRGSAIHDAVLAVNTILSVFGRRKTAVNADASRYGEVWSLAFSEGIVGGATLLLAPLLEFQSITSHRVGERAFHAFYAMLAGLPVERLQRLHLTTAAAEGMAPANLKFLRGPVGEKAKETRGLMDAMETITVELLAQRDVVEVAISAAVAVDEFVTAGDALHDHLASNRSAANANFPTRSEIIALNDTLSTSTTWEHARSVYKDLSRMLLMARHIRDSDAHSGADDVLWPPLVELCAEAGSRGHSLMTRFPSVARHSAADAGLHYSYAPNGHSMPDKGMWGALERACAALDLPPSVLDTSVRVMAAVLLLGQLEDCESAPGEDEVMEDQQAVLTAIADLLGVAQSSIAGAVKGRTWAANPRKPRKRTNGRERRRRTKDLKGSIDPELADHFAIMLYRYHWNWLLGRIAAGLRKKSVNLPFSVSVTLVDLPGHQHRDVHEGNDPGVDPGAFVGVSMKNKGKYDTVETAFLNLCSDLMRSLFDATCLDGLPGMVTENRGSVKTFRAQTNGGKVEPWKGGAGGRPSTAQSRPRTARSRPSTAGRGPQGTGVLPAASGTVEEAVDDLVPEEIAWHVDSRNFIPLVLQTLLKTDRRGLLQVSTADRTPVGGKDETLNVYSDDFPGSMQFQEAWYEWLLPLRSAQARSKWDFPWGAVAELRPVDDAPNDVAFSALHAGGFCAYTTDRAAERLLDRPPRAMVSALRASSDAEIACMFPVTSEEVLRLHTKWEEATASRKELVEVLKSDLQEYECRHCNTLNRKTVACGKCADGVCPNCTHRWCRGKVGNAHVLPDSLEVAEDMSKFNDLEDVTSMLDSAYEEFKSLAIVHEQQVLSGGANEVANLLKVVGALVLDDGREKLFNWCISPSHASHAGKAIFEDAAVSQQLWASSLTAAVEASAVGFTHEMTFEKFGERYLKELGDLTQATDLAKQVRDITRTVWKSNFYENVDKLVTKEHLVHPPPATALPYFVGVSKIVMRDVMARALDRAQASVEAHTSEAGIRRWCYRKACSFAGLMLPERCWASGVTVGMLLLALDPAHKGDGDEGDSLEESALLAAAEAGQSPRDTEPIWESVVEHVRDVGIVWDHSPSQSADFVDELLSIIFKWVYAKQEHLVLWGLGKDGSTCLPKQTVRDNNATEEADRPVSLGQSRVHWACQQQEIELVWDMCDARGEGKNATEMVGEDAHGHTAAHYLAVMEGSGRAASVAVTQILLAIVERNQQPSQDADADEAKRSAINAVDTSTDRTGLPAFRVAIQHGLYVVVREMLRSKKAASTGVAAASQLRQEVEEVERALEKSINMDRGKWGQSLKKLRSAIQAAQMGTIGADIMKIFHDIEAQSVGLPPLAPVSFQIVERDWEVLGTRDDPNTFRPINAKLNTKKPSTEPRWERDLRRNVQRVCVAIKAFLDSSDPVRLAFEEQQYESVAVVLEFGGSLKSLDDYDLPNHRLVDGSTIMHAAADRALEKACIALLATTEGMKCVDVKDGKGRTPLDRALARQNYGVAAIVANGMLQSKGHSIKKTSILDNLLFNDEFLREAVQNGLTSCVSTILARRGELHPSLLGLPIGRQCDSEECHVMQRCSVCQGARTKEAMFSNASEAAGLLRQRQVRQKLMRGLDFKDSQMLYHLEPLTAQLRGWKVATVAYGAEHMLLQTASGDVFGSGDNSWNQLLAGGEMPYSRSPVRIPLGQGRFNSIVAGGMTSAAVSNGKAFVWGQQRKEKHDDGHCMINARTVVISDNTLTRLMAGSRGTVFDLHGDDEFTACSLADFNGISPCAVASCFGLVAAASTGARVTAFLLKNEAEFDGRASAGAEVEVGGAPTSDKKLSDKKLEAEEEEQVDPLDVGTWECACSFKNPGSLFRCAVCSAVPPLVGKYPPYEPEATSLLDCPDDNTNAPLLDIKVGLHAEVGDGVLCLSDNSGIRPARVEETKDDEVMVTFVGTEEKLWVRRDGVRLRRWPGNPRDVKMAQAKKTPVQCGMPVGVSFSVDTVPGRPVHMSTAGVRGSKTYVYVTTDRGVYRVGPKEVVGLAMAQPVAGLGQAKAIQCVSPDEDALYVLTGGLCSLCGKTGSLRCGDCGDMKEFCFECFQDEHAPHTNRVSFKERQCEKCGTARAAVKCYDCPKNTTDLCRLCDQAVHSAHDAHTAITTSVYSGRSSSVAPYGPTSRLAIQSLHTGSMPTGDASPAKPADVAVVTRRTDVKTRLRPEFGEAETNTVEARAQILRLLGVMHIDPAEAEDPLDPRSEGSEERIRRLCLTSEAALDGLITWCCGFVVPTYKGLLKVAVSHGHAEVAGELLARIDSIDLDGLTEMGLTSLTDGLLRRRKLVRNMEGDLRLRVVALGHTVLAGAAGRTFLRELCEEEHVESLVLRECTLSHTGTADGGWLSLCEWLTDIAVSRTEQDESEAPANFEAAEEDECPLTSFRVERCKFTSSEMTHLTNCVNQNVSLQELCLHETDCGSPDDVRNLNAALKAHPMFHGTARSLKEVYGTVPGWTVAMSTLSYLLFGFSGLLSGVTNLVASESVQFSRALTNPLPDGKTSQAVSSMLFAIILLYPFILVFWIISEQKERQESAWVAVAAIAPYLAILFTWQGIIFYAASRDARMRSLDNREQTVKWSYKYWRNYLAVFIILWNVLQLAAFVFAPLSSFPSMLPDEVNPGESLQFVLLKGWSDAVPLRRVTAIGTIAVLGIVPSLVWLVLTSFVNSMILRGRVGVALASADKLELVCGLLSDGFYAPIVVNLLKVVDCTYSATGGLLDATISETVDESNVLDAPLKCWAGPQHRWSAAISLLFLGLYVVSSSLVGVFFTEDHSGLKSIQFVELYILAERMCKMLSGIATLFFTDIFAGAFSPIILSILYLGLAGGTLAFQPCPHIPSVNTWKAAAYCILGWATILQAYARIGGITQSWTMFYLLLIGWAVVLILAVVGTVFFKRIVSLWRVEKKKGPKKKRTKRKKAAKKKPKMNQVDPAP